MSDLVLKLLKKIKQLGGTLTEEEEQILRGQENGNQERTITH